MRVRFGRFVGLFSLIGSLILGGSTASRAESFVNFGASSTTTSWTQLSGWFNAPKYPPDERYRPSAGAPSGLSVGTQAAASPDPQGGRSSWITRPRNPGLGGFLSEVRGGVGWHDTGPVSSPTEDGPDINFEALFTSPEFLKYILSPRPHLGATINTAGDTSEFYFGLSWTGDIYENFFVEFSFGGSVHDGELEETPGRNKLGCTVLFRESLSAGVLFGGRHSLSIMYDHISNGGFCDDNDGQDDIGLRYGYRF